MILFKKQNTFKIKAAIVSFIMIAFILLPMFPFSTLTLAYEVKVDDESVGFVSTQSEFEQAQNLVDSNFMGDISDESDVSLAIVPQNSIDDADEISNEISKKLIANIKVVSVYGIYANDKCIAANKSKNLLLNAIESYKTDVQTNTKADLVVFDQTVQVKDCLSLKGNLTDFEKTVDVISENVDCKTGFYKTNIKKIKYKVINKKDNSLYKDETIVKVKGQNGKQRIKKLSFFKDGKKLSSEVVEKKTVKKVVNKVVVTGTKKLPNVNKKEGAKYAWPLKKGSSYYVSSDFGQRSGRLHKGIDIIADYGTKIVAAYDGVVTRSSWFESYGYCVDIKHADGTVTRYAHCSSLLVKVGQKVKMGDVIAKVGCTGRSTANHLHFEVRPNGAEPVNPYKYVKL